MINHCKTKKDEAVALLQLLVEPYLYPDMNSKSYQLLCFENGKTPRYQEIFSLSDYFKFDGQKDLANVIAYPANNNDSTRMMHALDCFMERFTYGRIEGDIGDKRRRITGTGKQLLEQRRFSDNSFSRLISAILDLLSEWTGNKLGKVHGRDVVNNIQTFFGKERYVRYDNSYDDESDDETQDSKAVPSLGLTHK